MNHEIKVSETRFPSLTEAVIAQLGETESMPDVCNHGAAGGFPGFTYYADTLKFYADNKRDILAMLETLAEDTGTDMLEMVAGFNCLKDDHFSPAVIGEAIWSGEGEDADAIRNALAWFALEEVSREMNPDL